MQTSKLLLPVLLLISILLLLPALNPSQPSSQFTSWKSTHSISYSTPMEDAYRELIFLTNLQKIQKHNTNPKRTYQMGINKFTGMTHAEFVAQYLYEIDVEAIKTGNRKVILEEDMMGQVEDIDWVEKGAVTRVKDQGQCTSGSWAFSATGSMQGLYKIAYGTLKTYSDQQLLDCSGSLCTCSGGFSDMSFRYIETHGLCQQSDYPYTGIKQACRPTQCTFKISDYDYIDNCPGMAKLLAQRPISVAVEASNWAAYKSGVFSDCTTKMNTMALLVGIVDGNWKVKNSWGSGWGEGGYIRIAGGNTCGICSIGLYPLK